MRRKTILLLTGLPLIACLIVSLKAIHSRDLGSNQIINPATLATDVEIERKPTAPRVKVIDSAPSGVGRVYGRVWNSKGERLADARVQLTTSDAHAETAAPAREYHTRQDGSFVFESLPLDTYSVVASKDDKQVVGIAPLGPRQVSWRMDIVLKNTDSIAGFVVEPNGTPIKNATLRPISHDGLAVLEGVSHSFTSQSDSRGAFVLHSLLPSEWRLLVNAKGWAPALSGPIKLGNTSARIVLERGCTAEGRLIPPPDEDLPTGLAVLADYENLRIDPIGGTLDGDGHFSFKHLPTGACFISAVGANVTARGGPLEVHLSNDEIITDLVINLVKVPSIRGRVLVQNSMEPISDTVIYAQFDADLDHRKTAYSKEDGTYEFRGLAPHRYALSLTPPPGYVRADKDSQRFVDVRLETDLPPVDFLVAPSGEISGIVEDESQNPMPNADVRGWTSPTPNRQSSTVTDNLGRFKLVGFLPGDNIIVEAQTLELTSDPRGPWSVGTSDEIRIQLSLSKSSVIAGEVVDGSGSPTLASLILKRRSSPQGALIAQTDARGQFIFTGLAADEFTISIGPFRSVFPRGIVSVPAFELTTGQSKTDLRLTYDEAELISIAGQVLDPDGNPVQHANVLAMVPTGQRPDGSVTDLDGRFMLLGLSDGSYDLNVFHSDYKQQIIEQIHTGTTDVLITLHPKGEGNAAVSGNVTIKGSSQSVEEFSIALVSEGQLRADRRLDESKFIHVVDSRGAFTISTAPVARVPVALIVRAEGYESAELPLGEITDPEPVSGLIIPLTPSNCSVLGVVQDSTGNPIYGARVSIGLPTFDAGTIPQAGITLTDSDGAFSIDGLTPGDITLSVQANTFATASQSVRVLAHSTSQVAFTLHPPGSIAGVVTYEGVELGGINIHGALSSTVSDDSGEFILNGLNEGVEELRASMLDATGETIASGTVSASVAAGSTTIADIELVRTELTDVDVSAPE